MHDKTRRRICLAGFFLFCIAPTLGAAAWCAMRHMPWSAQEEANSLGRQLGLEVRLAGLKYLRPGVVLYEDFELHDPETGQCLFLSRLLTVEWKSIADGQGGVKPVIALSASQPEIETAGLRQLGDLLQRAMQGQTGRPAMDLSISAGELTLRAGINSQTFIDVEGGLDNPPGGVQAIVSFRIPGIDVTEPVKIRAVRNRQTSPPASRFELSTGDGCLPCDLLAAGLPELGALGSRCRFRGYIYANQDSGGRARDNWSGEVTGQLLGVELDRLVTDHFPHKLSGAADVTIQTARFSHGRLEQAIGTILAGPGVVSRSLLQAAVKHLQLTSGADLDLLCDQVPYDRMALDLFMDGQGLRIAGQCSSANSGVVMTDHRLCLLAAPDTRSRPAAAFIQTLVPESMVQVPATDQTDWLVAHLPLPPAVAPQTREASVPSGQLRLRRE
ncbi:MAG: hypothetical protein ABSG67_11065 [Thermoguttaceae bacterium]